MVRPDTQDLRVWLVTTTLAAAGAFCWWLGPALPTLEPRLWWLLIAVLFGVSDRFVVNVPIGRDNHSLTFSDAPLVLGLLFCSTNELLGAALLGVGVSMTLSRRPAIKIAFNLASTLLTTATAVVVYVTLLDLLGTHPLAPMGWLALLVTTEIAHLVSGLSVAAVIALRRQGDGFAAIARMLFYGGVWTVIVTDLAVVTALLYRREPAGLGLLTVLTAVCFVLYRGYHVQRLRYGRLELLYQFTRSVDEAVTDETVIETIVREAKNLLRAQHGEVVLRPGPGAALDAWWRGACDGEVIRIERAGRHQGNDALRRAGHSDGMATPLREGGQVTAVLIVADRLDDVSTFDREDARLFEALAGHASIALANTGLVDRARRAAADMKHLSLHDHLTGLPNRRQFQLRLDERLLATGSATVLLMDLDRFKEVNDTLGHDVGDQLIEQVGQRLRRLEHEETVVARLGGDEFAVLLGDDDVHVEGMVQRVSRDFRTPFYLGDVELDVSASIGIATAPKDGSSAALLLRRAEVAMYDAKQRLAGVAHYSADRDPYSARRLSLISDLARALDERTLEVHYQPQAAPETGRVAGVEALLRWKHPVWGQVSPDEFIPLAEHTGLIRPLTRFVVETAIRQCAAWRDAGTPVQMAVNVSMRNLLEPELADVIARLLLRANLPAALLKLEVTESAIVSDPERTVSAFERMVDLGLSLSVDDFGTGYSSLTRLRNLPVHEVKIDREFVRNLTQDAQDLAIVKAVISLGHDLGLRVVAEGVEDEVTWLLLQELDCDLIQGYLLARPMPAEQMTRWLAEHFASLATRLRQDPEDPHTLGVVGHPEAPSPAATPLRRAGNGYPWSH